jgi:hypothetical protein
MIERSVRAAIPTKRANAVPPSAARKNASDALCIAA